ncbi:hypothetical protein LPJ75_001372 [Coemansia sp. RSA 2598]|nr:hypothetical protein LPJ75_001372 [Coemansia sp. RSA 2598]
MLALCASKKPTGLVQKHGALLSAGRTGSIPSVFHSRRWKKLPVEPPKPLPKFDIENIPITKSATVLVHNPLAAIEAVRKKDIERRKQIEAERFEKFIPPVRGLYPLAPLQELERAWAEFILDHDGIQKTFTRRYNGVYEWDGVLNLKKCFGDVHVFRVFRPKEYFTTNAPYIYRNEFNFNIPAFSSEQLLNVLGLYIDALHKTPAEGRRDILRYFFIIIKAIRARPKTHQKLVSSSQYKRLVMSYCLIANQPHLALYVAIDLLPKCRPETVPRWIIAKLLNLPMMFDGNKEAIARLGKLQGSTPELGYRYEREYNLNLLSQYVFEYYSSRKDLNVTDAELIQLIRLAESRMLLKELMDMLPLVIKRLVKGPEGLSYEDKIELCYEPKLLESKVNYEAIVARYALAFVRLGNSDMASKFMLTVRDMPLRKLTYYSGYIGGLAGSLVGLSHVFPGDPSVLIRTLEHFGDSQYDPMPNKLLSGDFLLRLESEITSHMLAGRSSASVYLTFLYHRISLNIPYQASFNIMKRIYDINPSLAMQWYCFVNFMIDDKKGRIKAWLLIQLRKDRNAFMDHFGVAAKSAPIHMAKLAGSICNIMYDYEADRRYVLARAFVDINKTRNAEALGSIIVVASMVPRKLLRPVNGPYTVLQRSHATAQLIRNSDIDSKDLHWIISSLAKACLHLNIAKSSDVLWREVLRHGIDPEMFAIKDLALLRLNKRIDMENTLEIVKYILRDAKLPWKSARIEDDQVDLVMRDVLEGQEIDIVQKELPTRDLPVFDIVTVQNYRFEIGAYVSLMDYLGRAGLPALVEPMAIYVLASSDLLRTRVLGVVSAVWLDSIGFNPNATSVDIQEAWETLKMYSEDLAKRYHGTQSRDRVQLNSNAHHSAIEAYIRKCDFEMAWHMIHVEMRANDLFPDVGTLCRLLSPLAVSENLWALGKQMVIKCNTHYPGVIKSMLENPNVSHMTKALVNSALQE